MSQAAENGDAGPGPDAITEQARSAEQAARIAELEDLRLRALADLDNMRKRCAAQVSRAEEEARAAGTRPWTCWPAWASRAATTGAPGSTRSGTRPSPPGLTPGPRAMWWPRSSG